MITNIKSFITPKALKRGILLGLVSLIGSSVFALGFLGKTILNKYRVFLQTAELSHQTVIQFVKSTIQAEPINQLSILVLGTDEIENRPDFPQLTDSIILAQVQPSHNKVQLLSLPRDLWSNDYKTKINALYQYGRDKNPDQPTQFPQEVISTLTQQDINHTLVISLAQLESLIQILGTIEVDVPVGFRDDQFPRNDVDITKETDPLKLYETVTFVAGKQQMDGERALKYIRSRHSVDPLVGTDLGRTVRQQQVIEAIFEQIMDLSQYWYEPQRAGQLFSFYKEHFEESLPLSKLLVLVRQMYQSDQPFQFTSNSLPIFPDDPEGVIEHPTYLHPYQNQWVYVINDLSRFRQFISKSLTL
ncbi:MAG TPA: LCP family protein [Candidatus Woesebacteria bacterium]|nr:LCP family protein [Candidatus Woesebacteria bacterium]